MRRSVTSRSLLRSTERWVARFAAARLFSAVVAAVLLGVHRVTDHDGMLLVLGLGYGAGSTAAVLLLPRVLDRRSAWALDSLACLALVFASEDWRSPFYLMALTAGILPAARLPLMRSLQWGVGFTLAYAGVAVATGLDVAALRTTARLDTFATHLLLPLALTAGVAYAAEGMRRLRDEQARSQRLAVEAERRRIAWELHDSAKQRLHAASLMLSSLERNGDGSDEVLDASLEQLRGAMADMDTSIGDLRSPLEGRPLEVALRERVAELSKVTRASIQLEGRAATLPHVDATHVYRILSEAVANAVRHADASRIRVRLGSKDGGLTAVVDDDGRGLPEEIRPGASGLLTMRSRAFAIGARLSIGPGPEERGTRISLQVPINPEGDEP